MNVDVKKIKENRFIKVPLLFFIALFLIFVAPEEIKAPTTTNIVIGDGEMDDGRDEAKSHGPKENINKSAISMLEEVVDLIDSIRVEKWKENYKEGPFEKLKINWMEEKQGKGKRSAIENKNGVKKNEIGKSNID